MPTPTDLYTPVIDISEHQGAVDFQTMRDRGVDGLIIRSNHATTVDRRCAGYVRDAREAGWRDDQLGFYTFCNPKRATGEASGKAFVDTVRNIFGHTRTLLMLDVEAYATESGGGPILKGPAFAAWIRDHIASVRRHAPDATVIAYSNAAFWNIWVGDQQLASELEWIVPRYPAYSLVAYQRNPLPTTPAGWPEWAWRVGPKGPVPPSGVPWAGWQFSAGFNAQGARYGCSSSDLDLNIVESATWRRWTRTDTPAPIPVPVPVPTDIAETEETVRIKVQDTPGGAPDVWFERIGMDLHTVSSGNLFAKMPGAKADESDIAVITKQEMMWEIEDTRYTYGDIWAAPAARLGPEFVALWNANHEPPPSPGGPGTPIAVPFPLKLTGTIQP